MGILARVAFFGAVFTLQCCVSVLGNISRDTIFLRSYTASSIAALTLLLSFTTAYALTAASQMLAALAQRHTPAGVLYAICPTVLALGLFALAVASLALPVLARGLSVLVYMWLEISAQLLNQQFWDLCAKAFDVSQSKKYFGYCTVVRSIGYLYCVSAYYVVSVCTCVCNTQVHYVWYDVREPDGEFCRVTGSSQARAPDRVQPHHRCVPAIVRGRRAVYLGRAIRANVHRQRGHQAWQATK
jgi:hypothetical protein